MPKKGKFLKIGVLIDQLVPGGVQKSAIEEAKNLKAMGHEVTLFVLVRLDYKYQYEDLSAGLKVVFLSDYNPKLFQQPLRIPYFSFLTHLHLLNPLFSHRYQILKQLDFIISHGTTTCITAQSISRKLKIPYMAFIWDPMIFIWEKVYTNTKLNYLSPLIKPLIRHYERSFLISAALVATSSRVHQQYIKNIYHVDPLIIHPGCIPPRKLPKKSNSYILGYSRWEMAKNPQLFLWLASKLPKVQFLLAGVWTNYDEELQFQETIKKMGLEKQVKLLSPITKSDLQDIAAKSIAWVHPNFEAFGMAGLEMAAWGIPIIIPKGSGVTEVFEHGKHGFFPNPEDKEAFLTHVKYLLNHPEITAQMGKAAAETARRHTWENHSITVLKQILKYHLQKKIVCLANAFVSTKSTGGGDFFMMELVRRLPSNIHLTIILPAIGFHHYQKYVAEKRNVRYLVLPKNRFDNQYAPIPLSLTYLIRSWQTFLILRLLPPFQLLHTATDLIPDTIPAFLFHQFHPHISWTSRFFHFISPPLKREGKLWINAGSYLLQQLSLKLLRQANLVMIDNPNLKKDLEKKQIKTQRIETHSGGVDAQEITKVPPRKNFGSSAIFIGRLQPHKGIFDAIDVWKQVVKNLPSAKLIMVGYGPPETVAELTAQINDTGLENNILLTGYILEREKLATYRRSSKLLLFLDHEAGFGLVNAEAMAAGLPVVAYNLPIFGTTFKNGFLTSPLGDTKAIADHVVNLLTDHNTYQNLSQQAKTEALKFDWLNVSQKFYQSLESLIPTFRQK